MLPASLPLKNSTRLCSSLPPKPNISIPPDSQSYANLLISYSKLSARHLFDENPHEAQTFKNCRTIHGRIHRLGLHLSGELGNALIDLYSKTGQPSCAQKAFNLLANPDQVSWNSILSAYLRTGSSSSVLIFSFYGKGKQMHCLAIKVNLSTNVYVGSSLVDFYGKVGELEDAELLFLQLKEKTLPARNALINGYVQNNKEEEALILFQEMQIEGIKPSAITFSSVLPACGGSGRVTMGKLLHCYMIKSDIFFTDDFLKASL